MGTGQKEIARRAGVTHATVSMALNDNPRISLATRRRVKRLAQKLDYRPNIFSRGLRGMRTNTIGILWGLNGPHYSMALVREISFRAMNRGYVTYIADSLADADIIRNALDDFANRRVDGVIMDCHFEKGMRKIVEARVKLFPAFVAVTRRKDESFGCDTIVLDRYTAIREIADHFCRAGRRRPVYLGPDGRIDPKTETFINRLKENGIAAGAGNVIDVEVKGPDMAEADCYSRALDSHCSSGRPDFDALFCSPDEGASAACAWLQEKGLKIPDDVSVVGFNDSLFSKFQRPPLASVARKNVEVAAAAERMLFSRLEQTGQPPRCEEIQMEFIRRESAG